MAKKGRRATEEERALAIRLIKEKRAYAEVAEILGVGESTVFEWWRNYRRSGISGIATKDTPGRPSSLSARQLQELRVLVADTVPSQHGYEVELWTRDIIGDLIRRRFRTSLSAVTVGRVMKGLGFSPQKPLYRAFQQDPEKVAEWKEKTYPNIRKDAAAQGARIFFADESTIRTDFHAGTTWAPVGQTPVVASTGDRKSIMMASAISPRGELRFHIHEGSFRSENFIEFCKQLIKDIDDNVFLIVDGSSVHKADKVKKFVQSTEGRLQLFFLPPYSPDLNPDEWVWKNVKNDSIGRTAIRGKDDLKAKAVSALRHLQKSPAKVRGFFGDLKLAYISA
jgi:transposase